jgi:hypothetical protein
VQALVDDVGLHEREPHGASVVPTTAVAVTIASRLLGRLGTANPRPAAAKSGPARIPDTM